MFYLSFEQDMLILLSNFREMSLKVTKKNRKKAVFQIITANVELYCHLKGYNINVCLLLSFHLICCREICLICEF